MPQWPLLGLRCPNVKETLGPVEQVADQYVPNIGGAFGIHVSAHLLATLAILAGFAVDYGQGRRQRLLRIEPWITTASTTIAVCGAFSLLNVRLPLLTVLEILRFGTLTLTMIVVASFNRTQIRIFTGCLAVAVLVEAGIVALQFMLGWTLGISALGEMPLNQEMIDFSLSLRPTGTIGNTNMMSYFFEMAAPVMLALALAGSRWHRWIFFVAFGVAVSSLVLSLVPRCLDHATHYYSYRALHLRAADSTHAEADDPAMCHRCRGSARCSPGSTFHFGASDER